VLETKLDSEIDPYGFYDNGMIIYVSVFNVV
jgi:hypothetical protein